MSIIKIPRCIHEKLSNEERVLTKFKNFYATDKRIFNSPNKTYCEAIEYDKISIELEKYPVSRSIGRFGACIMGSIGLGMFAICLKLVSIGPVIQRDYRTFIYTDQFLSAIPLGLMIGLMMYIFALTINKYYYQIHSPIIDDYNPKEWNNPLLRSVQKVMLDKTPKFVRKVILRAWQIQATGVDAYNFAEFVNSKTGKSIIIRKKTDYEMKAIISFAAILTIIVTYLWACSWF